LHTPSAEDVIASFGRWFAANHGAASNVKVSISNHWSTRINLGNK
jgi:hypothetical protein